ncbi:MAG: serine hydrolase domain-containing protein [Brevirhabdus sp.]
MPDLPHAFSLSGSAVVSSHAAPFAWWSITKTVLATAMMRLAEQGRVDLDAPFRDRAYTLRQLLAHTAGVTNYGGPVYLDAVEAGDPVWSVDELLSRRHADDLLFAPGSDWAYSNIGYLFVRQELERVLDQSLDDALRALVFDPLGICDTRIVSNVRDLEPVYWGNPKGYDPKWVYHGLLIGPPSDAVRFLRAILEGPLLSHDSRDQMLTGFGLGDGIEGRPWVEAAYGLGLMLGRMEDVGRVFGHSGVGPDTVSALYCFTDLPGAPVACAFAQGHDEGVCEWEVLRLARQAQSD